MHLLTILYTFPHAKETLGFVCMKLSISETYHCIPHSITAPIYSML